MNTKLGITFILALAALSFVAASFAADAGKAKAKTVVVTVVVAGFECPMCPDALQQQLGKVAGVSKVVASMDPSQVTATLDESKITASEFVQLISGHPTAMADGKTYTGQLVLSVDCKMCADSKKMCADCFTLLPKVLKSVKGVQDVKLDETGKVVNLTFTKGAKVSTTALASALAKSDFHFTASFTAPATATTATKNVDPNACPTCDMALPQ